MGPTSLGCHAGAGPVYGWTGDDVLSMSVGTDVVWGFDGNDVITGDRGDDILFGGDGDDTLDGGAGRDAQIGGNGDDTFIVDADCEVQAGEIIDGGPGTDVVKSHKTQSQLVALGLTFASIESFVTVTEDPQGMRRAWTHLWTMGRSSARASRSRGRTCPTPTPCTDQLRLHVDRPREHE